MCSDLVVARRYNPKIQYRLREIPVKYVKVWRQAQARRLDRDNIADLAKSIKNDGLLNPPLVQRVSKTEFLLMSGQRRLAAMKRLGAKTIPVHVIMKKSEMSLEEAKAASVVENIHRNSMDDHDVIVAARLLTEKLGKAKAAAHLGITRATLYKYLGFDAVPDTLKLLVPSVISRDHMTRLFLAVSNIKRTKSIAIKIQGMEPELKKQYLMLLTGHPKMSHPKLLKLARGSLVKQNISLRLTKGAAKRLKAKSGRANMLPNEYAKRLLEKALK